MKRLFLFLCVFTALPLIAQTTSLEERVAQIVGVIKGEKAVPLEFVTVRIKGAYRGTITNNLGVFSIAVLEGDTLQFSFVGYRTIERVIPKLAKNKRVHYIHLDMEELPIHLPDLELRALPTRAQFERDFISMPFDDDLHSIAAKNLSQQTVMQLLFSVPSDGVESYNFHATPQEKATLFYQGYPGISKFNPVTWYAIVGSLKSGAYKVK